MQRTFLVGCDQCCKPSDLLQSLMLIQVRKLKGSDESCQSLRAELQWSFLDKSYLLEMGEERLWCLCYDVQYPHSRFEVLDKSLEEGNEVIGLTDVSRDGLIDHIRRQDRICQHIVLFSSVVGIMQSSHQLLVLRL